MNDTTDRPRNRAESLAVENAKRIAMQMRAERNEAVGLAQQRRVALDQAGALLRDVRATPAMPAELGQRIDAFLAGLDQI